MNVRDREKKERASEKIYEELGILTIKQNQHPRATVSGMSDHKAVHRTDVVTIDPPYIDHKAVHRTDVVTIEPPYTHFVLLLSTSEVDSQNSTQILS